MAKAMTPEIKEAAIGNFIMAEDLLDSPIKLRLTATELQKDKVENKSTGDLMDKIIFYFIDNKGQEKEIGVLAFDGLVRQMNAVDPNIGDVLQLETISVEGVKYPVWKVDIVEAYKGDAPAKKIKKKEKEDGFEDEGAEVNIPKNTTGPVNKDSKDEEIKLEDIPF